MFIHNGLTFQTQEALDSYKQVLAWYDRRAKKRIGLSTPRTLNLEPIDQLNLENSHYDRISAI